MGDGIARVYDLDSFITSKLIEFDSATLGLVLNLDTSYVGVVLYSSWRNTNFINKPIPVGSGYAGRYINAVGAPVFGTGQVEMSYFRGLEPSTTAIIPIGRGVGPGLIGARFTDKSTVVINGIVCTESN